MEERKVKMCYCVPERVIEGGTWDEQGRIITNLLP